MTTIGLCTAVPSIGRVIAGRVVALRLRSRRRRLRPVGRDLVSVVSATSAELKLFDKRKPGIAKSAVAASALMLAEQMDDPDNSATSKSMCGRELREHMKELREQLPPAKKKDALAALSDDFNSRRQAQISGEPAA